MIPPPSSLSLFLSHRVSCVVAIHVDEFRQRTGRDIVLAADGACDSGEALLGIDAVLKAREEQNVSRDAHM